jgi:hypothetical protein
MNFLKSAMYKYRKLQPFTLYEKVEKQHYSLIMKRSTEYRDNSGWTQIDFLAKGPRALMTVGGDDKSNIKILDGTNYQQWAPKMIALLRSKELGNYINGMTKRPFCIEEPVPPPMDESGITDPSVLATYAATVGQKTAPMFVCFGKIGMVQDNDISRKSEIITWYTLT